MTMSEDDVWLGERLSRTLEEEARRHPLPVDFAASIAAAVGERAPRRSSWFSGLSAVAVTVVLAVIAVAVPLSLARPSSTANPGASVPVTQQPTSAASASPSPMISPSPSADASQRPLTEAEAVEIAVRADGRPGMSSLSVQFGPARQVLPRVGFEWADVPSDETWVWLISVWDGGPPLGQEGSFVVVDYFDGTIYGIQRWIS